MHLGTRATVQCGSEIYSLRDKPRAIEARIKRPYPLHGYGWLSVSPS